MASTLPFFLKMILMWIWTFIACVHSVSFLYVFYSFSHCSSSFSLCSPFHFFLALVYILFSSLNWFCTSLFWCFFVFPQLDSSFLLTLLLMRHVFSLFQLQVLGLTCFYISSFHPFNFALSNCSFACTFPHPWPLALCKFRFWLLAIIKLQFQTQSKKLIFFHVLFVWILYVAFLFKLQVCIFYLSKCLFIILRFLCLIFFVCNDFFSIFFCFGLLLSLTIHHKWKKMWHKKNLKKI